MKIDYWMHENQNISYLLQHFRLTKLKNVVENHAVLLYIIVVTVIIIYQGRFLSVQYCSVLSCFSVFIKHFFCFNTFPVRKYSVQNSPPYPGCTGAMCYVSSRWAPAGLPIRVIIKTPRSLGIFWTELWIQWWRRTPRACVCCAARTWRSSRWGNVTTRCVTDALPRCGFCVSRGIAPCAGRSSTRYHTQLVRVHSHLVRLHTQPATLQALHTPGHAPYTISQAPSSTHTRSGSPHTQAGREHKLSPAQALPASYHNRFCLSSTVSV